MYVLLLCSSSRPLHYFCYVDDAERLSLTISSSELVNRCLMALYVLKWNYTHESLEEARSKEIFTYCRYKRADRRRVAGFERNKLFTHLRSPSANGRDRSIGIEDLKENKLFTHPRSEREKAAK